MLPVYHAKVVQNPNLIGGTTMPCVLLVADSEGEIVGDYVVKIPVVKHIEQYQPTNKEVYSSVLAKHFNIKFGEYLHTLDPGLLTPYKEQLASYGHEVEDFIYIHDYLNDARNNITFFQRLLKSLIDPS